MEARTLRAIVEKGVRPIKCAASCAYKAQKGLTLGDLCAEAGHLMWALKVWKYTIGEIHAKDYDDWIDVYFHTEYVRFRDVISDGVCEVIGRRIDDVERRLGLSNAKGRNSWEYWAGDGWYDRMWFEKYDSDWDSEREDFIRQRDEAVECRQREQLFQEAQSEYAAQPQDFFDYWNDYNPVLQEDLEGKVDDWD
jgi:hypothetical protein